MRAAGKKLKKGLRAMSQRPLGKLGPVVTLRRARLKDGPGHYADIKALMSKRDILTDVAEEASLQ